VVTLVIVVIDEGLGLGLKVAGQELVFQQNAVFQGLVQRSILPWLCAWHGAPRTWLIFRALMYSASSPAM